MRYQGVELGASVLMIDVSMFVILLIIADRELIDGRTPSWWRGRIFLTPSVVVVTCAALGLERSMYWLN